MYIYIYKHWYHSYYYFNLLFILYLLIIECEILRAIFLNLRICGRKQTQSILGDSDANLEASMYNHYVIDL